ncbi:MAG: hypothetical protein LBQ52_00690 [Helicobacteraceae bacterium]|jgi:hypothetical protein|nr:hypothetical protein [Helicobacteraceae bacterium]
MKDTENDRDVLMTLYKKQFEKDYEKERFEFDIGYNFSFGAIRDLVEVFRQKWDEKNGVSITLAEANAILQKCVNEHWLKTDPTCRNFTKIHEELAERISEDIFSPKYISFDQLELNTAALIGKLNEKLVEGERTIIFAHSQGNLFGNSVFNALRQEYPNRIGMIGVASPAGIKYDKNYYYVTAYDDLVINLLRAANFLTAGFFVGDVLEANVDNNVKCAGFVRDPFRHGLYYSYLFSGVFKRNTVDWSDTEYEYLFSAHYNCPSEQNKVALNSREMIDDFFTKLLKDLRFPDDEDGN